MCMLISMLFPVVKVLTHIATLWKFSHCCIFKQRYKVDIIYAGIYLRSALFVFFSVFSASSDNLARLWCVETGEIKREYSGHQKAVVCLAFNDSVLGWGGGGSGLKRWRNRWRRTVVAHVKRDRKISRLFGLWRVWLSSLKVRICAGVSGNYLIMFVRRNRRPVLEQHSLQEVCSKATKYKLNFSVYVKSLHFLWLQIHTVTGAAESTFLHQL